MILIGLIAVVCLTFSYILSRDELFTTLPLVPLIAAGLITFPFLFSGNLATVQCGMAIVWFSWISLSSFQLSDLKERSRIDEVRLCFSEKAAFVVSSSAASVLFLMAEPFIPRPFPDSWAYVLSAALIFAVLVFVIHAFFSLIHSRTEDSLAHQISQTREQYLMEGFNHITEKYALSAREKEVTIMLAQGHSRTFIKDTLVISEGTTRAHIAHVYQKLGVHKKDDFLCLIKEEMEIAEREKERRSVRSEA